MNPFVAYLNTLQGTDANNNGSLAESQAKNPLFKELRVPHPLAQEILAELTGENGGNVILKGGAGISVSQGRSYKVRSGSCAGKTIPCVEIVAGREILDVYRPQEG